MSRKITAQSYDLLQDLAQATGWNRDSMIDILCGFVDEMELVGEFGQYAEQRAMEEVDPEDYPEYFEDEEKGDQAY